MSDETKAGSEFSDQLGAAYVASNLPRNAEGAPCQCNGYADLTDERPTDDEIKKYDCGRRFPCCTAVFVCRVCGKRFIGKFQAPEFR